MSQEHDPDADDAVLLYIETHAVLVGQDLSPAVSHKACLFVDYLRAAVFSSGCAEKDGWTPIAPMDVL